MHGKIREFENELKISGECQRISVWGKNNV